MRVTLTSLTGGVVSDLQKGQVVRIHEALDDPTDHQTPTSSASAEVDGFDRDSILLTVRHIETPLRMSASLASIPGPEFPVTDGDVVKLSDAHADAYGRQTWLLEIVPQQP